MILKEFGILLAEEIFLRKNFILFLVTSFYSVFFFFLAAPLGLQDPTCPTRA